MIILREKYYSVSPKEVQSGAKQVGKKIIKGVTKAGIVGLGAASGALVGLVPGAKRGKRLSTPEEIEETRIRKIKELEDTNAKNKEELNYYKNLKNKDSLDKEDEKMLREEIRENNQGIKILKKGNSESIEFAKNYTPTTKREIKKSSGIGALIGGVGSAGLIYGASKLKKRLKR